MPEALLREQIGTALVCMSCGATFLIPTSYNFDTRHPPCCGEPMDERDARADHIIDAGIKATRATVGSQEVMLRAGAVAMRREWELLGRRRA